MVKNGKKLALWLLNGIFCLLLLNAGGCFSFGPPTYLPCILAKIGVQFQYPESWECFNVDNAALLYPHGKTRDDPLVQVSMDRMPPGLTIRQLLNKARAFHSQQVLGSKVTPPAQVSISGKTMYYLDMVYPKENNVLFKKRIVYYFYGKNTYFFEYTCANEDFNYYVQGFDHILQTLRVAGDQTTGIPMTPIKK